MTKGCDYAWDRPNLPALHAAGIRFICRYLSYDKTGKNLTQLEAIAIRANGMDIVSNWEYNPLAALHGRAQGVSDAATGINQHVAIGGPGGVPIYFSVDFDAQDSDMRQIAAYIDGATATIGWERVGVYGGLRVIEYMKATNRCKYFWQTSAWSGGQWHPAAQIRQVDYEVPIGGGRVDIDQSMSGDYGGWGGAQTAPPPAAGDPGGWDPVSLIYQLGDQLQNMGSWAANASQAIDGLFR